MKEQKRKNIIMVILALVVIAIAVIVGLIIYNTPANRLSRQLDLGEKYLEEENYEQAVVEFDRAIAIDPKSERAYIGKAAAYVGMGDYEQAAATYETGLQMIPESESIRSAAEQFYSEYAQIYMNEENYGQAINVLENGDRLIDSDRLKDELEEARAKQKEQEDTDIEETVTEEEPEEEIEDEPVEEEEVSAVTPPGIMAAENNVYRLNTAVERMDDSGEMLMGAMDISFSQTQSKYDATSAEHLWDNELAPYNRSGYEWRNICVDIETLSDTSGGMFYYNWRVNCDDAKDWGESVREYNVVSGDFTVTYNNTDYTECKFVIVGAGDIDYTASGDIGQMWTDYVYVLLPQGYDGNIYYTVYGTTLDGNSTTRNEEECVTITF